MNKNNKPEIRIQDFEDEWKLRSFSAFSKDTGRKNNDDLDFEPYAITKDQGFVRQNEAHDEFGYMRETNRKAYNIVEPCSFAYNPARINVGSIGYYDGKENVIVSSLYEIFQTDKYVDDRFLWHWFKSDQFPKWVQRLQEGSVRLYFYYDKLRECQLYMPIVAEQKSIAAYFDNLDKLIFLHQQEIERLLCVRKAMINKMFPQNGKNIPSVRFSGYTEPWRYCELSEVFTERHIIDTISDEYPQLSFTIEEGVIRPEDRKTNKRDFLILDKDNKKYLQTEYDDIIYNPANVIYGAIHRNALGKGCVSPIYKIFYTEQDSTFMECIVRHPRFIKEISRSMEGTVKKLRTLKPKAFLEMSAYIAPTIEEQQQIGEYFRQMDRLIEIEKEELEKIKHIKSACMEKMFV